MSRVINIQNLFEVEQARKKNPSSVWVGGASNLAPRAHKLPWLDVSQCEDLSSLKMVQGVAHVGGAVPLGVLGAHAEVARAFPLLAQAVNHTATPQIRTQATVAGALCQGARCPYIHHGDYPCSNSNDGPCSARGDEGFPFALIDNTSCAALHPSTLALALSVLEASIQIQDFKPSGVETYRWTLEQFFNFDPAEIQKTHALPEHALLTTLHLDERKQGNVQRYLRLSSRQLAEWADVEVVLNAQVSGDTVQWMRCALGAVGRKPIRLLSLEQAMKGQLKSRLLDRAWVERHLPAWSPLPGQEKRVERITRTLLAVFREMET